MSALIKAQGMKKRKQRIKRMSFISLISPVLLAIKLFSDLEKSTANKGDFYCLSCLLSPHCTTTVVLSATGNILFNT
jgi:hypothetical protein